MSTELCLHELEAVKHTCVDVRQEHSYIPRKDLFTSYVQTLRKKKQIMDYLTNVVFMPKGDAVIVKACIRDQNFTGELRELKVVVKYPPSQPRPPPPSPPPPPLPPPPPPPSPPFPLFMNISSEMGQSAVEMSLR
jgi:hypothetical protein